MALESDRRVIGRSKAPRVFLACLLLGYYRALAKKLLPRSFGIMELGKKSRKIFEFKGLICKIFRNKDLACQRALKMGLGQLRGPSWLAAHLWTAPSGIIVAPAHLWVCDGGHWLDVMKDQCSVPSARWVAIQSTIPRLQTWATGSLDSQENPKLYGGGIPSLENRETGAPGLLKVNSPSP
jgi:hypothetical protein